MAITLDEAKALEIGDILYDNIHRNADGSAQKWRVNGKVKRWKKNKVPFLIGIKYGLYSYDYLTEDDLERVSLVDPTEIKK